MPTLEETYQQYLGRPADEAGLAYWNQQIASGAITQEQAVQAIQTSGEAQTFATSGGLSGTSNTNTGSPSSPGASPSSNQNQQSQPSPTTSQPTSSTPQPTPQPVQSEQPTATQTTETTQQVDTDQLNNLYQELLGRDAQQAGIDYWLNSGLTSDQIRQSIQQSPEFQARQQQTTEQQQAAPATQEEIQGIYQELLGRPGQAEGVQYWVDQGLSPDQIRAAISESPEFQNLQQQGGTEGRANAQQIRDNYQQIFGREISQDELNQLLIGGTRLTDYQETLSQTPEGQTFQILGRTPTEREVQIVQLYQELLGRVPNSENLSAWAGYDASLDQIRSEIMQGPEYQDRERVIEQQRQADEAGITFSAQGVAQVQQNAQNPYIPASAMQTYTQIAMQNSEFLDPNNPNFIADPVQQAVAVGAQATVQQIVDNLNVATVDPALAETAEGVAAQGTVNPLSQMVPPQGTLSVVVEAAQGETPPEALVSNQLETLLQGIEDGNIPSWAQPAVDQVEAQLSARGLSRSSVGQAALTNAIIQSAIPLASQNAQTEAATFMANLNNQQQAAIVNAQNQASLDIANLNVRAQAASQNAQAFLQIDMANLSNRQQTAIVNQQMRQQTYLSNQAAQNAAAQFNATSQNQADQFITQLNATIQQQNAARETANSQFNAGQANALSQFNTQLEAQREQFNATMASQLEQSNVNWRRQVNTVNTAGINAVNQANAMNAFNLSNQSLTFLWQEYRDAAKWQFDASQNQLNRETQLAMAALSNEAVTDAQSMQAISQLGAAALNFFRN